MGEYELVICIVNQGFTEIVMDAARSVGATGGTIIKARGAGSEKAGELFGITFQHEKEMVFILTKAEKRTEIMSAVIKEAGLNSKGKGICFSLPVDEVMGTAFGINDIKE